MSTKRDATADLATCDATGDTEWAYEFYSTALPYWLREVERLRDVEQANLTMAADLIAMEGTIKELRHELDRSRNAHGKAELEVARLKGQYAAYAAEVAEFNAGYQAAKDGLPESAEPERCPHDVWMCGYAWAKFGSLKAEVERLREANTFALSENARMKNALEEIEQVGHNPAHLACDLMDEHPGMEDRLWALVNRLADMANRQVGIAQTSRKQLYCNEGPQGSHWHDVMARLRHAILPEINADSTFLTIGQVRALVAEIEKLESLVAEANSELAGVTDIYRRAYTAIGACDISNFLAKCEQAAGFEQREHDLEQEIARLSAEASALDRLRAWAAQGEHRDYSVTIDSSDYMLHIGCVSDIDTDSLGGEWWILVSGDGDGVPSDECIVLGTPDNPATLAEMVDAALERWSKLYGEQQ